jgi:hypothetical protein
LPTIRYDVSGVEGGGGEQPQPGTYNAEITEVEHRTERADGTKIDGKGDIHVVLNVGSDYARLHTYVGMYDATAWKLREFIDALDMGEKGSLNTTKLVGQKLRVLIAKDEYEGAYKARVKTFLKAKDGDEADEEEETDEEEPEEEEVEEDEEEEEDEVEEEEEPEEDEADPLDDMDRSELKKHIKSEGIEVKVTTKMSDDDIREAIRAQSSDDGDDYDEWSLAELKEQFEQRDLKLKKGDKATKAALIAALRADDAEEPF